MLRIESPIHGAVVNHRWGVQDATSLSLPVTGTAPLYGQVTVNGQPVEVVGGRFSCTVPITEAEQDIEARYEGSLGAQEHRIRVVWDRHSKPRYRFSIDDNSFWLRDIAKQRYASLFDCFYLDILRRLHTEYGTKFTLNIYFETDDGWLLTDFPETYKSEFAAHADWLGLAFHAWSNSPDRPYQYASAEKLLGDMAAVQEQIVRFAGEQTLIPPTVIHWGMVLPEVWPSLYGAGIRALSAFAQPTSHGHDVHYWMDEVRSDWLYHHEAIKDFPSGLLFSRIDIVCNNTPVDQIEAKLQPLYDNPLQAEIMDLFTHEQYFWPFYSNYIPDHAQRLDKAIRWVTERGYEPVFQHEGFLGGQTP